MTFLKSTYEKIQLLTFHTKLEMKHVYHNIKCFITGGHNYKINKLAIGTEHLCSKCSKSIFIRKN